MSLRTKTCASAAKTAPRSAAIAPSACSRRRRRRLRHGQVRPEHDHDADQPDEDRRQAEGAHLLAEEHRREDHREERRGIAERGRLGQRQEAERGEAEAHGRGADQPAPEVPERMPGLAARGAGRAARSARRGSPAWRRTSGRTPPAPGGTCGAEALMQIAISVKTMTERTLRPMPRSGFMEARSGLLRRGGRGSRGVCVGPRAALTSRRRRQPRCPSARAQSSVASSAGAERREHLVHLLLGDDHRRAEGERVADRPGDHAARHQLGGQRGPTLPGTAKPLRPLGRQLERAHQPEDAQPRRPADAPRAARCAGEAGASPRTRAGASMRS